MTALTDPTSPNALLSTKSGTWREERAHIDPVLYNRCLWFTIARAIVRLSHDVIENQLDTGKEWRVGKSEYDQWWLVTFSNRKVHSVRIVTDRCDLDIFQNAANRRSLRPCCKQGPSAENRKNLRMMDYLQQSSICKRSCHPGLILNKRYLDQR